MKNIYLYEIKYGVKICLLNQENIICQNMEILYAILVDCDQLLNEVE